MLVGVADGLGDAVLAGVGVGLGMGLGAGEGVGLGDGDGDGDGAGLGAGDGVGLGVADGGARTATLAGTSVTAGASVDSGTAGVGVETAAIDVGDSPTTGMVMPPRCITNTNDRAALSTRISNAAMVAFGIAGPAPFAGDDASVAPRR